MVVKSKKYNFHWHNDACERSQERLERDGHKRFFCLTHNQWAAEIPVKTIVTFIYGDDSTIIKRFEDGRIFK